MFAVVYKDREMSMRTLLFADSRVKAIKMWEYFNPTIRWLDAKRDMELREYKMIEKKSTERVNGKAMWGVITTGYEMKVLLLGASRAKAIRLWEFFNPSMTWGEINKIGGVVIKYEIIGM